MVIIAASLKLDFLRGCEYGAGTEKWESVCGPGAGPDGVITKIWVPFIIIGIAILLALIFYPVGAEKDEDGLTISPGTPLHMVVPYNYYLLVAFTFCTSIGLAKISLAA